LNRTRRDLAASEPSVDAGRLGVYAALGASTSAVPLPWFPDWLAARVRGSLVHDVAARRGVSLSPGARAALADVLPLDAPRGMAPSALRFLATRVVARALLHLGPAGLVWPLAGAMRTYALGALLDRYFDRHRTRGGCLEVDEARRVRRAIDAALGRAMRTSLESDETPEAPDDTRDATTVFLDSVLGFAAGLPSRVVRHLDAAFDETIADDYE